MCVGGGGVGVEMGREGVGGEGSGREGEGCLNCGRQTLNGQGKGGRRGERELIETNISFFFGRQVPSVSDTVSTSEN